MKNRIKIFSAISAALGVFFLLAAKTQAAGFFSGLGDIGGNIVGKGVSLVGYAILSLLGALIGLIAKSISWILQINMDVLTSPTVQTGWIICRDIANLGSVLILILIALVTVLRYKSYGSQQLLIKLIGAAIIVNFSLTIAGFILNFTNVLAGFFINRAFGDLSDIGAGLAGVFNPQKLLSFDLGTEGGVNFLVNSIMNISTGTIFSLLILIILICFMILFLIRYVILTVLLIVSPIAWLMWILPATQSLHKKWWTKFIQWCFFAPACLFFLYLAMIGFSQGNNVGNERGGNEEGEQVGLIRNQSELTAQVSDAAQSAGAAAAESRPQIESNSFFANIFDNIMNILVFGGLAVGGLLAANSFGLMGAKAVVGAGTAASKVAGKWALKNPTLGIGKGIGKLSDWGARKGLNNQLGLRSIVKGTRFMGSATGKVAEKLKAGGESKIGKMLFGKDTLLGSTWAATKKESGLFKKGEKKENLEKELGAAYSRQTALEKQQEALNKKALAGPLTTAEISQTQRIKDALDKVSKDIEEKEKDLGKMLGTTGGDLQRKFYSLLNDVDDIEKKFVAKGQPIPPALSTIRQNLQQQAITGIDGQTLERLRQQLNTI